MKIYHKIRIPKALTIICLFCVLFCMGITHTEGQVKYPDIESPGTVFLLEDNNKITLKNKVIEFSVFLQENRVSIVEVANHVNDTPFKFSKNNSFFSILPQGRQMLHLSDFYLQSGFEKIYTEDGVGVKVLLNNLEFNISIEWLFVLNNDQNFIRHFLTINSSHIIEQIKTFPVSSDYSPRIVGVVDGSPFVTDDLFWAIENPMFTVDESNGVVASIIPYDQRETLDLPYVYQETLVVGAYPERQLRRAFAFYLDKIRVRPYTPITFYDSWYDLSYGLNVLTEEDCIDRVKTWGDSLTKRSVKLDYFLWDSGWDDWNNVWNFNPKLHNGFKIIKEKAAGYGSLLGAWLSPWGGYDTFFPIRISNVRERYQIFQVDEKGEYNIYKGLTLTDPHYYQYFKGVIVDLIKNHGVKLFKIDGMGPGKDAKGGGKYTAEMYELIRMIKEIRVFAPNVHINLTVGTWTSPFWLCYADNIWKGGSDYGFSGEGNRRQRWMSFRDLGVLDGVTRSAPLLPISAVMLHGVTIADSGPPAKYESEDHFIEQDIWSFFASGTSLQELYVNPHKLNSNNWDVLAKAIQWTRDHKDVLIDANWVGGDPSIGEVYGYGAWGGDQSVLMLRNPSEKPQEFILTLNAALELPLGYDGKYSLLNVINNLGLGVLDSRKPYKISLKPFEVMVLNIEKIK